MPFIVKQPGEAGAGRRVALPVQHIDLLPTLLDLVRAPMPSGLRGRSLRAILDKTSGFVPDQPIYAELLAPQFRFDGQPLFALSNASYRFVRGIAEQLRPLVPDAPDPDTARFDQMRAALDRLLEGHPVNAPAPPAQADEDRLAAFGYLPGLRPAPLAPLESAAPRTSRTHRTLHRTDRQINGVDGIAPRSGRADRTEALLGRARRAACHCGKTSRACERAVSGRVVACAHWPRRRSRQGVECRCDRRPDDAEVPLALASTLLHARRVEDAAMQADQAVALADAGTDARIKAAAHEIATRVALAREDAAAATMHAAMVQKADPHLPMPQFVAGRLAYDDGRYPDALAAFKAAAATAEQAGATLAELHLNLGNTYARLDRYAEAEAEFQEELREFPHNIGTYASLAMLYRASNRHQAVEQVIGDLVEAAPTPEGYSMAARLWTIVGERGRAEALRSDARRRFRGDPSLALLGRSR